METQLLHPQKLFTHPVRYDIPDFQRRYVWRQEEQWEPLWEDVAELAQSIVDGGRTEPHFMGAVVLQQKRFPSGSLERRIVVDGQQRLITLQLLADAIQEILEGRGHSDPAKRLSTLVANSREFRDGNADNAFKVWPTTVDRAAFRHAMSNDLSGSEYATSRIVQAHEYFKGQAGQWLDKFAVENGDLDKAASALEKAVREKLALVTIDLGDSDDPHVIFETLNARGTPLLQSDMVKNKILHDAKIKAVDLHDDYDTERSPLERQLWAFDEDDWWTREVGRGLQRRPRIDMFLNHWLTLRNRSETKAYEEFRIFEKYVESRSNEGYTIHDVANDIRDLGVIYREVEEVQRADIGPFLERRNVMNVRVVTPLLLWLLSSDVPPVTLRNCLRALESFLVRRVVCGYSARSYGELFVTLIARLAKTPVDNADRVVVSSLGEQTAQATLWPNDQELRNMFLTAPLYQWLTRGRLRMVLTGIEEQLRTDMAESQEVPKNLHIEHIMPQAWHRNWSLPGGEEDDSDAATYRDQSIHTIGNLTLVNGRLNSSLSNAPWESKRETLGDHSVLFLNKQLVNKGPEIWDEQAIEKRAGWLHNKAVKIWPHADGFDIR